MPTCGNCYAQGQTIDHVRECHRLTHEALLVMELALSPIVAEYDRYRKAA